MMLARSLATPLLVCGVISLTAGCPEEPLPADDAGGGSDAASADATADAAVIDGATNDATLTDAAMFDRAVADTLVPDAAISDQARPDSAAPDATQPDLGSQPYLEVISPNGEEQLPVGFPVDITWRSANLADTVFLYYSKDLFFSDNNLIAADQLDDGRHTWTVPDDLSNSVRVKVAASLSQDSLFDYSDLPFEIVEASITVTSPNGGEVLPPYGSHEITWTSEHMLGEVKIELSRDDFVAEVIEVVAATPNDGSFVWDPVYAAISDSAKIRVSAIDNPAVADTSDAPWSFGPWLHITSPDGGEELRAGGRHEITWTSSQEHGTVALHYSRDGFVSDVNEIAAGVADTGSYLWEPIPDERSSTLRVRVSFESEPGINDSSDADLSIREGGWARAYPSSDPILPTVKLDSHGDVYFAARTAHAARSILVKLSPGGELLQTVEFDDSAVQITDVAIDSDDRIYLTGTCSLRDCDVDPTSDVYMVGDGDAAGGAFLVKLDTDGDLMWAEWLDGISYYTLQLSVHGNSSIALAGIHWLASDLDPDHAGGELPHVSYDNAFVASFAAASGNFSWVKSWGGSGGNLFAHSVDHASDGSIYVGGETRAFETDFNPGPGTLLVDQRGIATGYVVRYLADGTFAVLRVLGGTGENRIKRALLDPSDGIYVIGQFGGAAGEEVDFDTRTTSSYNLTAQGYADAFVAKYDSDFFIESALSLGGDSDDSFRQAALCGTGELRILARAYSSVIDLGPAPGQQLPRPAFGFLFSVDSELTTWTTAHWGGSSVGMESGIACDAIGRTYVGGLSTDSGHELAPVGPPCLNDSHAVSGTGTVLVKYMPDLCW